MTPRFDCELPPNVRVELTQSRRAVIIHQPAKMDWRIFGFAVLGTFTATALLVSFAQHPGQGSPKPVRAIVPLPPVQNAPVPIVEAPRAIPVLYKEWVPQLKGWILVYSVCTPARSGFIADYAPRAQLIKNPWPQSENLLHEND